MYARKQLIDALPLAIRSKEKIKATNDSNRSAITYIVKLDKVSFQIDASNKSNVDNIIIESNNAIVNVEDFDLTTSRLLTPD